MALEGRAAADDILIGDTPKAVRRRGRLKGLSARGRLWKHSGLADIDGVVTPAEMQDFFVFTLVRNPWDRLVSYYAWLQDQRIDHPAARLAQRLDFSAFLRHPGIAETFRAHPYGASVSLAGRDLCNLYLRLERLSVDLPRLEAALGQKLAPLPWLNRSDRRGDYRTYYSDQEAAVVADFCAEDIARFGYCFDPEG